MKLIDFKSRTQSIMNGNQGTVKVSEKINDHMFGQVYSRRNQEIQPDTIAIFNFNSSLNYPNLYKGNTTIISKDMEDDSRNTKDLVSLRKKPRRCTQYLIYRYVTYSKLNKHFKCFVSPYFDVLNLI